MASHMDKKMAQCIADCSSCYQRCLMTTAYCLKMGGEHADPKHIALLQDCAEACKLSESSMLRGSDSHKQACALCADICEKCAESCERIGPDDEEMSLCAAVCAKCEASCRNMQE